MPFELDALGYQENTNWYPLVVKLLWRYDERITRLLWNMQEPVFQTNENGDIKGSDGIYYKDTPQMRAFIKIAISLKETLPATPDCYVRLWRGNRQYEVSLNPSYTNSLEGIALALLMSYKWPLSYIDIPREDLSKYERRGGAPWSEFILPSEIVKKCHIVWLSDNEAEHLKLHSKSEQSQTNPWNIWGG